MGIERIYSLNNTELLASIEIDHREVGLYRSTDKGLNWISVDEGLDSNYVYSFDYNTEGYIFVATNKGIYRTISSVVAVEEEHQANSLVTISPNPANDYFDINLLHEKSEFISISIFDVLGNRLIDVACGYYGAGNQNFKVNAGSLPQGIYYMNIKTGNESFFKPIMIVK
jgi:hypothetical protein